jgi:hypothetical protein
MAIPPTSFIKYDFSDPACYPGSGTTITDLSTNLDGELSSAGLFVSDGQQSYINITTAGQYARSNGYNFPTRNVYTISVIFKTYAQFNYNTVVSLAQFNGSGTTPFISTPLNHTAEYNFPFSSNAFGVNSITSNLKIKNDTWNLLTLTADGTTQKLYLNGILVGSVAHTASFNGSLPRFQTGYPTFDETAIQKVAVMHMWESALTATQVKDLADSYATRFSLYQPVVSYDFSETESYPGSGSTFSDLAGSTNGSTNSTTFVSDGDASYFTTNGSSTFLSTSSYTPSSSTVFSYNLWFQLNNTTYGTMLQIGGDGSFENTPAINTNDPSAGRLLSSFGYFVGVNNPSQTIPVDTWKCITVVCDGSTSKVYYDGLLVSSVSQGSGIFGVGPMHFGRYLTFQYASVKIALFQLFNTALDATAVLNNYNNQEPRFYPAPPPSPVLIGSYDFSDPACYPGTGDTAFDLTANNNDLVMNASGAQPSYGGTGQSKSFSFLNDNNNFLYCSQFSALGTTFSSTSFTLSAWHNYANSQLDNAAILFGGNGANDEGVTIQVTGNDGNKIYGGTFGDPTPAIGTSNTANTWHMSTLTGDGTTLKLYQDGALIDSASQSGGWNGRGFVLGRYLNASYAPVDNQPVGKRYAGLIGIAEVYSGALGSTDISDLYDLQQPRFYPAPPPPYVGIVGGRQFAQGFNG